MKNAEIIIGVFIALFVGALIAYGTHAISVRQAELQRELKVEPIEVQDTLSVEPATGGNYNPQQPAQVKIQGD